MKIIFRLRRDKDIEIHIHPAISNDFVQESPTFNLSLPFQQRHDFIKWITPEKYFEINDETKVKSTLAAWKAKLNNYSKVLVKPKIIDEKWVNAKNEMISRARRMSIMFDNLEIKQKHWDAGMKELYALNGQTYKPRTSKYDFLKRFSNSFKARYVNVNSDDKLNDLNLAFDTSTFVNKFDEYGYFYALDKNAIVLTMRNESFVDNEQSFLSGYFKNLKILHPMINPNALLFDIAGIVERDIENDFLKAEDEFRINFSPSGIFLHNYIYHSREKVSEMFAAIIDDMIEIKRKLHGKRLLYLRRHLQKLVIFDSMKSLAPVNFGDEFKIDPIVVFSVTSERNIAKAINRLEFLKKIYYNVNQLTIDHFEIWQELIISNNMIVLNDVVDVLFANQHNITTSITQTLENFLHIFNQNNTKNTTELTKHFLNMYLVLNYNETIIENEKELIKRHDWKKTWEYLDLYSNGNGANYNEINLGDVNYDRGTYQGEAASGTKDGDALPADVTLGSKLKLAKLFQKLRAKLRDKEPIKISFRNFMRIEHLKICLDFRLLTVDVYKNWKDGNNGNVAINIVGFLGGNVVGAFGETLESKVSKAAKAAEEAKAAGVVEAGTETRKIKLFKVAAPFLSGLSIPFTVLDLTQQIKSYNTGNEEALINIFADSLNIAIDGIGILLALAVAAKMLSTVPSAFGPIGAALGIIISITQLVISAYKTADAIDAQLNLTTFQKTKFIVAETFKFVIGEQYEDLKVATKLRQLNQLIANNSMEVLNKNEQFKAIYFPSAAGVLGSKTIKRHTNFDITRSSQTEGGMNWDITTPQYNPPGGVIYCAPHAKSISFNLGMPININERSVTHNCHNAIGIRNAVDRPNGYVVFDLKWGKSTYADIQGSKNDPNYFIIGNGVVNIEGGDKNDLFKLATVAYVNAESHMNIDGGGGENTIDIMNIPEKYEVIVNFQTQRMLVFDYRYNVDFERYSSTVNMENIHIFFGRRGVNESITVNPTTKFVNGRGGSGIDKKDKIWVPKGSGYNLTIQLADFTDVINDSQDGIQYIVTGTTGIIVTTTALNTEIIHKFIIDASFVSVTSIDIEKVDQYYELHDLTLKLRKHESQRGNDDDPSIQIKLNVKDFCLTFNDNSSIIVKHSVMFAIVKSEKEAYDIKDKLLGKAYGLDMTIFVKNDRANYTYIMPNKMQTTIKNDPDRFTIIYVEGGSNNYTFAIDSSVDRMFTEDRLPRKDPAYVLIEFSSYPTSIIAIDLTIVVKQIRDYGKEVIFWHENHTEYGDLRIELIEEESLEVLMSIVLRNVGTNVCKLLRRLSIVLNNAPMTLNCDENRIERDKILRNYKQADRLAPVPLTFNDEDNIVIRHQDVDINSQITVHQTLGQYQFIKFENHLLLTNLITYNNTKKFRFDKPCSIWFPQFDEMSELFYTVDMKFDDKKISMNSQRSAIDDAREYEDISAYTQNLNLEAHFSN